MLLLYIIGLQFKNNIFWFNYFIFDYLGKKKYWLNIFVYNIALCFFLCKIRITRCIQYKYFLPYPSFLLNFKALVCLTVWYILYINMSWLLVWCAHNFSTFFDEAQKNMDGQTDKVSYSVQSS